MLHILFISIFFSDVSQARFVGKGSNLFMLYFQIKLQNVFEMRELSVVAKTSQLEYSS